MAQLDILKLMADYSRNATEKSSETRVKYSLKIKKAGVKGTSSNISCSSVQENISSSLSKRNQKLEKLQRWI